MAPIPNSVNVIATCRYLFPLYCLLVLVICVMNNSYFQINNSSLRINTLLTDESVSSNYGVPGKKIVTVITGTGRSGSSLLMALFSKLHLPTGFGDDHVGEFLRTGTSGFEFHHSVLLDEFARKSRFSDISIYKSPWYVHSTQLHNFTKLCQEYKACEVIVLMRNTTSSAFSRYNNFLKGIPEGNLTAPSLRKQIEQDSDTVSSMISTFVENDLPMALVSYPRFSTDAAYLYRKLKPFFVRHNVSLDTIDDTLKKFVNLHVVPKARVAKNATIV
jgi:hypothetical protein